MIHIELFLGGVWEILYFQHVIRFWVQLSPLDIFREERTKEDARMAWIFVLIGSVIGLIIFAITPTIWPAVVLYFTLSVIKLGENWGTWWHKSWMTFTLGPALFPAFLLIVCLLFFPWLAFVL